MLYANIIIDISHEKLDKSFQYIIPAGMENEIHAGVLVYVPFGKGNRQIKGYVIEVTDKCEYDISKMKYISSIEKKGVPIESVMIELAWFIKEHYGSTMNHALKTVIPVKMKTKETQKRTILLTADENRVQEFNEYLVKKRAVAKKRLLDELIIKKELSYDNAVKNLKVTANTINEFEDEKIISVVSEREYRNPLKNKIRNEYNISLNKIQQETAQKILESDKFVHLIHGVTGCGKTEIYIKLIDEVIKQGKEAIVMIPEIALTYQTVMRFYAKFGDIVSIVNSKLSGGEKYDQFELCKEGKVKIMIGPRSAVFTPFKNLGLIIMDEEHESSYKSDNMPRYHAREVAIHRAKKAGAKVVLGSATPSLDSYHKAVKNEYVLHEIDKRANNKALPKVYVEDMREELKKGNKTMFSAKLDELIRDRLAKKEQIILFINRRGYAGFVSCRSCGEAIKCSHCDVSMTLHKNTNKLVCHYCNYTIDMPKTCPKCDSKYIAAFGTGTQKVEEAVKKMYKNVKTVRMDADTTKGKEGHEKIIKEFAMGNADILIGTQMIVKGHDFKNVTLVGVIAADMSLYASDFMASERTFQLLTQACGRAGRGETEGDVVIQTYSPQNQAIEYAAMQDYKKFYKNEIVYRGLMEYPPISNMLVLLMSAKNEELLQNASEYMKGILDKYIVHRNEEIKRKIRLIGPTPCVVSKVNDVFRMVIYMKSGNNDELISIKNKLEVYLKNNEAYKNITVQFDFNPLNNY